MAISQADKDALERALVSGELTVEIDGRRVTYRSIAELRDALGYVERALAVAAGPAAAPGTTYASFSRD
jgi:hypothetical protein